MYDRYPSAQTVRPNNKQTKNSIFVNGLGRAMNNSDDSYPEAEGYIEVTQDNYEVNPLSKYKGINRNCLDDMRDAYSGQNDDRNKLAHAVYCEHLQDCADNVGQEVIRDLEVKKRKLNTEGIENRPTKQRRVCQLQHAINYTDASIPVVVKELGNDKKVRQTATHKETIERNATELKRLKKHRKDIQKMDRTR